MRFFLICLSLILFGCSFGGFKPAPPYFGWSLYNENILFPSSDPKAADKYLSRRKKDMEDCGMDFVIGESDNPKVNLCLEKKGWYLEGGPACENTIMWDKPLCVQWRKKYSKPDAKPWQ